MSLSRSSSSAAPDTDPDPFFEDLETAIKKLIDDVVNSQLDGKSDWVTLTPNPNLGKNHCWCGEDKEHNFKTCSQRQSRKSPPTVSADAKLSHCPHTYNKIDMIHNCFCFQIASTMKLFHQFFLRPRILAILTSQNNFSDGDPVQKLGFVQEEALRKIAKAYNKRVPISRIRATVDEKYKALARFLTDMRRGDIVSEVEKRFDNPWHIERVHAILGWHKRGVDACVADLGKAIDEASRHRISVHRSVHACIVEEDISFY